MKQKNNAGGGNITFFQKPSIHAVLRGMQNSVGNEWEMNYLTIFRERNLAFCVL